MWSQIKRFVDDLRYELLIIAVVMIVIPLVGASYLISGLTDPIDMQQLEQVAQSTRIAIGQSVMATGVSTSFLMLLLLIITTKKRWKNEDRLTDMQNTLNTLVDQNKILMDKLHQISTQTTQTDTHPYLKN